MKKLIALFVALVLCLGMTTAAFAEDIPTVSISWEEVEPTVIENGWEGEFVTLDDIGLKVWLPTALEEIELTDEDLEDGFIAYFMSEDETLSIGVTVHEAGATFDDYIAYLQEIEVLALQIVNVNGADFISYTFTNDNDVDCNVVSLINDDGDILEFAFTAGDPEFEVMSAFIVASIQPAD